jgi:outer membrane murein-binding lipoprotein Lpp
MITIKINGTVFCADTIEEATALAKAFDLPLKGEGQSSHDVQIRYLAIKHRSRARMVHQLNKGLTEAGQSAAHALGAVATIVTPLAGGVVSAAIGKAGTLAEALGAKLQQMSKAAKVRALRSFPQADLRALLVELDELKPPDDLPSSYKGPSTK